MKITKTQLREIIREEISKLNESSYKLGKVEYTKNKLTPSQILDLTNVYINTPITKVIGTTHNERILAANDVSKLTGTIQHLPNKRGKSPALLHQVLESGLISKDEYIKLYKQLINRHKEIVNYLNNSDPSNRPMRQ